MGDHGIKVQIGEVFIQFQQATAGNLMDSFFVHLIHQPKSSQVGKNFNGVQAIRGRAIRKVYMGKVGVVRVLPEYLLTIGIDQILGIFQRCPLSNRDFGDWWLRFSAVKCRQRADALISSKN